MTVSCGSQPIPSVAQAGDQHFPALCPPLNHHLSLVLSAVLSVMLQVTQSRFGSCSETKEMQTQGLPVSLRDRDRHEVCLHAASKPRPLTLTSVVFLNEELM